MTTTAIFGEGQHPAGLNVGDSAAFALPRMSGQRLLFKGGDFGPPAFPPRSIRAISTLGAYGRMDAPSLIVDDDTVRIAPGRRR